MYVRVTFYIEVVILYNLHLFFYVVVLLNCLSPTLTVYFNAWKSHLQSVHISFQGQIRKTNGTVKAHSCLCYLMDASLSHVVMLIMANRCCSKEQCHGW